MSDREKVIAGLESCRPGRNCGTCPYHVFFDKGNCNQQLEADALALLKAQEPRVMTLEEARWALHDEGTDIIYWEEKGKRAISIGVRGSDEIIFPDGDYADFDVLDEYDETGVYGIEFRLWTSRPTPEQMANTLWEVGEIDG